MFGAGAPGQNTLGKHNIEIGLATRQLGSTRKIPLRSSIFRRIFKILCYARSQVGFCTYQTNCDGRATEEETCGELKEKLNV